MSVYVDLLIMGNDLAVDTAGIPLLVTDRQCIAQDIEHLIRESGLLLKIVGMRDPVAVKTVLQQLMLLIEDDVRLVPGTVDIVHPAVGTFYVTAETMAFGPVDFYISL